MLQPSSAASSCAPFTLPPGAEYSGGVHWYVRGVLKKKAGPTLGSSIGWYSCSCGGGHKRLEEKKERSKLGHSGSCKSEMSHCCLMEFSAAPLWKSWHAVSLLPDGGPLGSCFHGALFARQPDRCWGILPPLVCKQNAAAPLNENLGPVCLWLTVKSSVRATAWTQLHRGQTINQYCIISAAIVILPVRVLYLTTQGISLCIKRRCVILYKRSHSVTWFNSISIYYPYVLHKRDTSFIFFFFD